MINLLDIKNEMPKEIFEALNELYSLAGTKEIFEKHGIELMTAELEMKLLDKVITDISEVYATDAKIKEFTQVQQYTEMQIKTNETMLQTAEGFMKQMIEMNITTAKNQLEMAIKAFTPDIQATIKNKLTTVANEGDRNTLETVLIGTTVIDLMQLMTKAVNELKENVPVRYENVVKPKVEVKEEIKTIDKKETTKAQKKEEVKPIKAPKEENKVETKADKDVKPDTVIDKIVEKDKEVESELDGGLDFSNFGGFGLDGKEETDYESFLGDLGKDSDTGLSF